MKYKKLNSNKDKLLYIELPEHDLAAWAEISDVACAVEYVIYKGKPYIINDDGWIVTGNGLSVKPLFYEKLAAAETKIIVVNYEVSKA